MVEKTTSIKIEVQPQENFSAASLMYRYATMTPGIRYANSYFGDARLYIDGKWYGYDHWSVTKEGPKTVVTLYLKEATLDPIQ